MSTNISSSCLNSSEHSSNVFTVCTYSFICIVGLIFNLIALAFFFKCNKARSQTTVYMSNLTIADTLLILTLPMRIFYHLGYRGLPQWLCDTLGLVLKANMYGSIFLLTCICFDRCMALSFPLSARVKEGRRKAPLVCLGIWTLTFGASVPIYLIKRRDVHDSFKHCFNNLPVYATQPVVVYPSLILGFGIPLVIMLVCSWGLVRAVRQSTVAQTNQVDGAKIQRMVASSLFIFIFSFLPYHATLGLLSLYRENIPCSMLTAYHYSVMLACLNTVLDPVAYYFTTETFTNNMGIGMGRMIPLNSHSSDTRYRANNS
ncbi:lysophosphatidic acid receptor 6-like [Seriola lalandi dorsalis]|uniref:lysophosphatidic acid receptor 6-like n=1 Tax=Seriola lalandi dorsalis TaxID=1841481 RepID=UPI000C6FB30F|nr:lysophosphatidic acid receptor 6-like [Seriola lalandi dorsalis]